MPRFVSLPKQPQSQRASQTRIDSLVADLESDDQRRYRGLERRWRAVIAHLRKFERADVTTQGEGLRRLPSIYLRLLW
ncbi:MAG: hypothetical protein HYY16_09290 [Planctomycetes bacterium]|nr:hypothetical protein [Planctomycetota bacterium]